MVWFPRNLEYTGLTSTLSAFRFTVEKHEIILKSAQASAMLGELRLKTDKSQQGDEEDCEESNQGGTPGVKRLGLVLVNVRVKIVIIETDFCIYL